MQLDLTQIRDAETPVARQFDPAEIAAADDAFQVIKPVELVMTVQKDDDLFQLVGRIRGDLELACSRCLEPFTMHVDAPFDLRYLPQHLNMTGSGDEEEGDDDENVPSREVGGDDLTTAFYRDDEIDLTQLVREQIYLLLPMKPLHSEDCKGLCPNCGTNLNEKTCECRNEWEDPRLAPLKALKKT
jgi:uncharacterized protein